MNRNHENIDSAQKDILISTMKKQLYELKKLGHEHLTLVDEVKNIQSKHNLLDDQNHRLQTEHRTKSELNRKVITQLRNEIDSLKIQIHKCSVQIDDLMRENTNLKRICQNRDSEIAMQLAANNQMQKNNEEQIEVNNSVNNKIKSLKDERNKCQAQYQRLKKSLDEQIANLKALEKQARHLDATNAKMENIIHIAEKDHSGLVQDLKTREQKVQATNMKLNQLKQQRQDLKDKTMKLEKQCAKSQTDLKNVKIDLESAINKNRELTKKLKSQQNVFRNSENQLEKSKLQRQSLNKEHIGLDGENKVLNSQIDRCLFSIMEYEKINQELQREIQYFMECDEEARTMLNRKENMKKLLDQVSTKLHKTSEDIAHLR